MNTTLGSLCTFLNGGTPSKRIGRYFEGKIPWITGADIISPIAIRARAYITKEAIRESATNEVPAGTVLLVTRTNVGKVAVSGVPLCFSQDITAIMPDPRKLHTGYFIHFLRTKERHFKQSARGATIKGITRNIVSDLQISLPPLSEQRRIAEVLDRADALRAKRRAALAQLDTLTQAIFLDMFGNLEAQKWPMVRVADVVDSKPGSIRTGPFGSQLLHSEFIEKGIAVLGIDNAVNNEFHWANRRYISATKYRTLNRYTVNPGDVLITIMGTCGRCAIVPDDIPIAINTKHLCCITLDNTKCLPSFLHAYFLRHPIAKKYLTQKAKGAIMEGLNMGIIKNIPIPIPPMDMQYEYRHFLESMDKLKANYQSSMSSLDSLFSSLQHRAFRGEL